MPPPPSTAFSSTGSPSASPHAADSSRSRAADWSSPWYPGSSGTPAASISRFAASFEPIARIADAGGPMNVSPAPTTASANCAFSERKP